MWPPHLCSTTAPSSTYIRLSSSQLAWWPDQRSAPGGRSRHCALPWGQLRRQFPHMTQSWLSVCLAGYVFLRQASKQASNTQLSSAQLSLALCSARVDAMQAHLAASDSSESSAGQLQLELTWGSQPPRSAWRRPQPAQAPRPSRPATPGRTSHHPRRQSAGPVWQQHRRCMVLVGVCKGTASSLTAARV